MAFTVEVKVVPSSGRQHLTLDKSNSLRCYLKSPPEGGKANKELISFLANILKIPQTSICIVYGATSRKKVLNIKGGYTKVSLLRALGIDIETQQKLW